MSNTINMNISGGSASFGPVVQGEGNVVIVGSRVNGSLNHVQKSGANEALVKSLEELHKAVFEMCNKLSEQKQSEVAKDLESFSTEAVSKVPRKEWYELSAKGLIEAANTIGQMAAPVVTAVQAVLALM